MHGVFHYGGVRRLYLLGFLGGMGGGGAGKKGEKAVPIGTGNRWLVAGGWWAV
jgi:hypothetical protein